jgi:hypothetical protein
MLGKSLTGTEVTSLFLLQEGKKISNAIAEKIIKCFLIMDLNLVQLVAPPKLSFHLGIQPLP